MLPTVVHRVDPTTEFLTPERCWILESWNVLDDPHVSVSRARVEPGVLTQLHTLRGVDERYVIVEGEGEMRVGDLDPAPVGPGDIVSIPEGVSQQIRNLGSRDLIFYCVCAPRFEPSSHENLEVE
jgi:mannose-6-phosphate isomerase-like protein (cupin superfamily)